MPGGANEMSKQALALTEQNMKAAFDHARKLVRATDLQDAMRIQSEFLRSQFTNAGEHMRQIYRQLHVGCAERQQGQVLAPSRQSNAKQKRDEQARERRFTGDRAHGCKCAARSSRRVDRLTEAIDRGPNPSETSVIVRDTSVAVSIARSPMLG